MAPDAPVFLSPEAGQASTVGPLPPGPANACAEAQASQPEQPRERPMGAPAPPQGGAVPPIAVSSEAAEAIAAGMPRCQLCNSPNTRPSVRAGIVDAVLALAKVFPFRCRVCQYRFYKRVAKASTPAKPTAS